MDNNISPINKCGYESIWIAFKCKNPSIIEKYYLMYFQNSYYIKIKMNLFFDD